MFAKMKSTDILRDSLSYVTMNNETILLHNGHSSPKRNIYVMLFVFDV